MTSWGTLGPEPAGRPDLPWLPLLKLCTLSENMCTSSLSPRLLAGPPPRDQSQIAHSPRLGRSDPGCLVPGVGARSLSPKDFECISGHTVRSDT